MQSYGQTMQEAAVGVTDITQKDSVSAFKLRYGKTINWNW
ncbi:hypothetical protein lbkm_2168 [Lachnospiraceae bacterium KM106-2]|nr:hypothetical protein lbkm_2168 [Lachnospiraceae bacterium KM106-2]